MDNEIVTTKSAKESRKKLEELLVRNNKENENKKAKSVVSLIKERNQNAKYKNELEKSHASNQKQTLETMEDNSRSIKSYSPAELDQHISSLYNITNSCNQLKRSVSRFEDLSSPILVKETSEFVPYLNEFADKISSTEFELINTRYPAKSDYEIHLREKNQNAKYKNELEGNSKSIQKQKIEKILEEKSRSFKSYSTAELDQYISSLFYVTQSCTQLKASINRFEDLSSPILKNEISSFLPELNKYADKTNSTEIELRDARFPQKTDTIADEEMNI